MTDRIADLRKDYTKASLDLDSTDANPYKQFEKWFIEAQIGELLEPNAMVLSTVDESNQPFQRTVLMKALDSDGIVFYTNYKSRKGTEITENPNVALLFYWDCCERQVRFEGQVKKIDPLMSDDYFAARPRISKIGAWASEQSAVIPDRANLEERVAFFEKKFPNEVPRPPHWGGLIVEPTYLEFWQGRLGRLHDRICFEKTENNWSNYRIAP